LLDFYLKILRKNWKSGLLKLKTVDATTFRDAMSRFAGAVHVVTTDGAHGRRGVTVSAACSVSDNPPTLLVCLNRGNPQNAMFEKNGAFTLNTLGAVHKPLAVAFSGKDHMTQDERFALAKWESFETGTPVLNDALVSFECKIIEAKEIGRASCRERV
jgi:cob(II)yrinic acid a,c-diamide reductase